VILLIFIRQPFLGLDKNKFVLIKLPQNFRKNIGLNKGTLQKSINFNKVVGVKTDYAVVSLNGRVSLTNALKSPGSILPTYENMYSHSNNPESASSVPTICKNCENINKKLVDEFQAPARISALECLSTEIDDLSKIIVVYTNFSSIISWEYVNLKSSNPVSKAELSSFQVQLFDNGNVRMSYGNLSISNELSRAVSAQTNLKDISDQNILWKC